MPTIASLIDHEAIGALRAIGCDHRDPSPFPERDQAQVRAMVARAQRDGADAAAAFGELYKLHRADVHNYALRRVHDVPAAEDITQDVFLVALRRLHDYRTDLADFGAWLTGIAHRLTLKWQSRHARGPLVVDMIREPYRACARGLDMDTLRHLGLIADDDPADSASDRLDVAAVWAAVDTLAPLQRQALALQLGRDMSADEIAAALGVSRDSARQATLVGVRRVRERLGVKRYPLSLGHFQTWCDSHGVEALPAAPRTVVGYLTDIATTGRRAVTVQGRATAITQAHNRAGFASPCADPAVRSLLRALRCRERTPARAAA